ncbi:hypothetical protein [Sulfitobacter sp. S190]|uniref:hypothetical protein n=1 Tax=Sulfitobacter sp. S190 TaxID=2867022 RepID=UPI0021A8C192|nr:hypothetical protein [Sulfitobacter sp. S190]UWR23463.1 hypothetical protein K3756_05635 [Sulfitobacter sp. S190]
MSKAVTNEEVEDVLSSIRRLVSEDKRPIAGTRTPAPPAEPQRADKLVLTPSLRVADTDEAEADAAPEPQADAEETLGTEMEDIVDTLVLRTVAKEQDAPEPVAQDDDDTGLTEPDDGMAEMAEAPMAEDVAEDADASDGFWDTQEDAVADADAEGDAPDVADPDGAVSDETLESYLEDAQTDDADPWAEKSLDAPDVTEDADDEARLAEEAWTFRRSRESLETPAIEDTDGTIPLMAKIAALETAIGSSKQQFEPDDTDADDLSGSEPPAMAWEDHVELDATGAPLDPQPADLHGTAAQDAPEDDGGLGEDQLLDEEALRDMISEIVRSELQGALGERITRNVRKLVRREIHRALTAQDLE